MTDKALTQIQLLNTRAGIEINGKVYPTELDLNPLTKHKILSRTHIFLRWLYLLFQIQYRCPPVQLCNNVELITEIVEAVASAVATESEMIRKPLKLMSLNIIIFADDEQMQSLDGESGYVTAALGNTWSHSVNTRLIVQYLDGGRREVKWPKY